MRKLKVAAIFLVLFISISIIIPFSAFAAESNNVQSTSAMLTENNSEAATVKATVALKGNKFNSIITPFDVNPGYVAELRIYASSDATGSSIPSTSGHAWVVITNYQTGSATIGQLSGIGQFQSLSIGTWGNRSEHIGTWYNLEAKFASQGAYTSSVSLSKTISYSELLSINSLIANNDSWSNFNNCSDFAIKIWNSVSSTKLSNGVFHTPTTLRDSIKAVSGYITGNPFSSIYDVFYAQGYSNPPIRSTVYN